MSVLQIVQRSALQVVTVQRGEGMALELGEHLADVRARASDRQLGETVREAVRLYRIATTVKIAPLKLVADQLGVSVSTATRMMARARATGLAEDLLAGALTSEGRIKLHRCTLPSKVHSCAQIAQNVPHCGPDQYSLGRIRVWHRSEPRSPTANSWPQIGRIPFAAGCFRTSLDVVADSKTRVIPRKLSFDVAMQNAQNVFESLQGHGHLRLGGSFWRKTT
ncbi:hypothetical protein [Microbacterium elymi]|uniref:Uncharacterized protein n=1 Tax=Microbacterium elymi TaxID=2909587 RepID=A0ABY5NMW3_9MICO|nr:hypothetical protein [Microbacterium elymi]UUT36386.1 hypothetical protein L2X98_26015 [Microbacterium elymi]